MSFPASKFDLPHVLSQQYRLYEQFFLKYAFSMLSVLTLGYIFIEEIEPCQFEELSRIIF